MKNKKSDTNDIVVRAVGTGENYATAKDALAAFDWVLKVVRTPPERRGEGLPPELAAREIEIYKKSLRDPSSRFSNALYILAAAFDAANKIVDEKGNGRDILNEIFNRVFLCPEIVKALDDLLNTPEKITRECLAAMNKAEGGFTECGAYSDILDYFLDMYENDLVEKLESARENEKGKLTRELNKKRFEMFPLVFNGMTHNVREGFTRFIVKTPLGKSIFPLYNQEINGIPLCDKDFIGSFCHTAHRICEFVPDEDGRLHIPMRGGGGCKCWGSELRSFGRILKKLFGIEDREEHEPDIVIDDKKNPVSDYAAQWVIDYQESPIIKFTFRDDRGRLSEIDLEHSKVSEYRFLRKLIRESKKDKDGWVIAGHPEWLNHRRKASKTIREFVLCIDKRVLNGETQFRITGKEQEWPSGAPEKKSNSAKSE